MEVTAKFYKMLVKWDLKKSANIQIGRNVSQIYYFSYSEILKIRFEINLSK